MHRFKGELLHTEYPHLCISGGEKKKLTLYPQIIVKSKDLKLENSKQRYQIMMGAYKMCKGQQLREMNVQRAIVVDREDQEMGRYIAEELNG